MNEQQEILITKLNRAERLSFLLISLSGGLAYLIYEYNGKSESQNVIYNLDLPLTIFSIVFGVMNCFLILGKTDVNIDQGSVVPVLKWIKINALILLVAVMLFGYKYLGL